MAPTDVQLTENVLNEISEHAYALGMGLQNAAPPCVGDHVKPIKTVQYLTDLAVMLQEQNRLVKEMPLNK